MARTRLGFLVEPYGQSARLAFFLVEPHGLSARLSHTYSVIFSRKETKAVSFSVVHDDYIRTPNL